MATILLFMTLAASAAAVTMFPVPDSSIYVVLGAGIAALVLLRRRTFS
jgi:hypothetical protein